MSPSGSSAVTVPVTVPMALDVSSTVAWPLVGALFVVGFGGAMDTFTDVVVVPPNPSPMVKVTVSVLVAALAPRLSRPPTGQRPSACR